MIANQQNYNLPTMPFRRDIPTGCPVGTVIQLVGKPYEDKKPSIFVILTTNNNDMALRMEMFLGQPSKLKIDCTVSQKTSTAVENLIVCPYNQRAVLKVVTLQHSFQIFFNDAKVADFVHRVDPNLVKSIQITGPMITEEVTITPAAAAPLPTYEQATSPPIELMANMSLGNHNQVKVPLQETPNDMPPPPQSVLNPTVPAGTLPFGMPSTASTTATTSSSFYYTGGSQGFSNHPYPLPGLIDNTTHPSQQNNVGQLPPQTSIPSAPPITQAPPTRNAPVQVPPPAAPGGFGAAYAQTSGAPGAPGAAPAHMAGAYATSPIAAPPSSIAMTYTPAPTPSVPYTTYPQSAAPTPVMTQLMQQPNPIYQNQQQQYPQGYNPYLQSPTVQQQQVPVYPVQGPTSAAIPVSAMQPQQLQYTQNPYMYPTTASMVQPMVQPYPVYQQYPMGYGYGYGAEMIYYDGGYHHGHHYGHHHHHCD